MTNSRLSLAAALVLLVTSFLPLAQPARADAAEDFLGGDPVVSPAGEAGKPKKKRVAAEIEDETLPIEVALMYSKLLREEPDYNTMIFSNQALVDKTRGFGGSALIDQHRESLRKIHDGFNADTVMHANRKITLTAVDEEKRTIKLDGMAPDLPLIYIVADNRRYGVFLRNAAELAELQPPFEHDNMRLLARNYKNNDRVIEAGLTFRPVVADRTDFKLNDGYSVHVIVADVVQIVLNDKNTKSLLLKKRFKDWQPEAAREADLLQSELLQPLP